MLGAHTMEFQTQPLVSVVTPVYNGERYLRECIESVLAQTYQNWDYTIVNNCSTDRSLEIAQEYADKDSRISIHNNQEFLGIIANHRTALRRISERSKYCKVVFADDWLFPECITKMVELAEANLSVGIVGAYGLTSTKVTWNGLPYQRNVVSGREICRSTLLGGRYIFGTLTSLLIRSDLVRALKAFDEYSNLHADTEACYELLQHSDFGFVHQILTYTRTDNDSTLAYCDRINTLKAATLLHVIRHGPVYLTEAQLASCVELRMKDYYRFLAQSVLQSRGTEFWVYHKTALEQMGHPLNRVKLFKALSMEILDILLNPKRIIGILVRRCFRPLASVF